MYGQLYIFDPAEAAELRHRWDAGLRLSILEELHDMMTSSPTMNPYASSYRHMHEQLKEQEQCGQIIDVVLRFRSGSTPDPRRYNEPTARDIAAVYSGLHPNINQRYNGVP